MLQKDGLVVFAKRACETCVLIENEMLRASREIRGFQVVSQDDPQFPAGVAGVVDDRALGFEPAVVYVPHPVQNRTAEELAAVADAVLAPALAKLTTASQ